MYVCMYVYMYVCTYLYVKQASLFFELLMHARVAALASRPLRIPGNTADVLYRSLSVLCGCHKEAWTSNQVRTPVGRWKTVASAATTTARETSSRLKSWVSG